MNVEVMSAARLDVIEFIVVILELVVVVLVEVEFEVE